MGIIYKYNKSIKQNKLAVPIYSIILHRRLDEFAVD